MQNWRETCRGRSDASRTWRARTPENDGGAAASTRQAASQGLASPNDHFLRCFPLSFTQPSTAFYTPYPAPDPLLHARALLDKVQSVRQEKRSKEVLKVLCLAKRCRLWQEQASAIRTRLRLMPFHRPKRQKAAGLAAATPTVLLRQGSSTIRLRTIRPDARMALPTVHKHLRASPKAFLKAKGEHQPAKMA